MLIRRFITAVTLLGAATAPVMAQEVDNATEHATWVGALLVILLTALTVMISIKNSKRSHQD
jgi:hypothetical protein